MTAALSLAGVSASLHGVQVLSEVNLEAAAGEVVGLVGPNGAGKTSLLRVALGLLDATGGPVRLGGADVRGLGERRRAELAAYLPQSRRAGWNLAAWRLAALGAPFVAPAEAKARALAALGETGIAALAERGVMDMSGGEAARAHLARLLVARTPLILADEPAAGLDPDAALRVMEILRGRASQGAAVVVTLHDLTLAIRTCDRIVVLAQGRVLADGPPHEALGGRVLGEAFGLSGGVAETPWGRVLAARRL
ncbi:MAG TPA: ABC transporter ATP-binding protein [Caulobacteraceae bacterium]|jgi:iron complex transport system ATP-binding protein|nr:ABC transporter ATP-binding protein [Caulobacteraceae bacterium]